MSSDNNELIDSRPGKALGLGGVYANVPAFQIVNDTHDLVVAFTGAIISLKYGPYGERLLKQPRWAEIEKKNIEFNQRRMVLGMDAVAAAALADEVRAFMKTALDPLVAGLEGH